jgi:thiamine biosynthesis lipoprotein
LLSVLAAAAWLLRPSTGRLDREFLVFGSSAELSLRGDSPDALRDAADAIERRLAELHRDWHPWQESALMALNRGLARGDRVPVPGSLLRLIATSAPLVQQSGGRFDPAAGGLISLWGFHADTWPARGPAPPPAALDAWLAQRPRLEDLSIVGDTVRSDNPAVQLDFNAIAEGAAIEDAFDILRQHAVSHALIDLGGDVGALGDAGGRPWRVALRDPRGGALGFVELGDGEVLFASGGYHKFRETVGVRLPHVVDPRTARPVVGTSATAVLHRSPTRADAAATALMVAGPAEWQQVSASMGLGCVLVLADDDTLYLSRAMHARLQLLRQPARVQAVVIGDDSGCVLDAEQDPQRRRERRATP